ncbi:MAG: hypothetical protein RLZZ428_359 [Pseudomonadota bacterium]
MSYLKLSFLILFLLTGCGPQTQEKFSEAFQSDAATGIKKDFKAITNTLLTFKKKLDQRNPKSYHQSLVIENEILHFRNSLTIQHHGQKLSHYKTYLQTAFSQENIAYRNDYLILGLYKMVYETYEIEQGFRMTGLFYNKQKFQNLYKNLQIISWRLKKDRDKHGNYLFLTWQNNWQIELEKRLKEGKIESWCDVQNLEYIKNRKESVFAPSNFTFEVLFTMIEYKVRTTMEKLGYEPEDLSIKALKSLIMFL